MTDADRFRAAHATLLEHGVRLDGHDLDLKQVEQMAAIAQAGHSSVPQQYRSVA